MYLPHCVLVLFSDQEMAQEILATDDPRQHKALGRKVRNFEKAVWDKNCQILVKKGNLAKVGKHKRTYICTI